MKKMHINESALYIGSAREISRLYKGFLNTETYKPSHSEMPKFNFGRMYGLYADNYETMYVVTAETALELLNNEEADR